MDDARERLFARAHRPLSAIHAEPLTHREGAAGADRSTNCCQARGPAASSRLDRNSSTAAGDPADASANAGATSTRGAVAAREPAAGRAASALTG